MKEQIVFDLVLEIGRLISSSCESIEDSQRVMRLVKEMLEIRWSIVKKPSSV